MCTFKIVQRKINFKICKKYYETFDHKNQRKKRVLYSNFETTLKEL